MKQNSLKNKVKHLLLELDMTQTELAEKIGVHKQVIANWLNGSRTPKTDNLKKLAGALNVPVVELLEEDGGGIVYEASGKGKLSELEEAKQKIKEFEEKLKFKDEQIEFLKEKVKFYERLKS